MVMIRKERQPKTIMVCSIFWLAPAFFSPPRQKQRLVFSQINTCTSVRGQLSPQGADAFFKHKWLRSCFQHTAFNFRLLCSSSLPQNTTAAVWPLLEEADTNFLYSEILLSLCYQIVVFFVTVRKKK